MVGPQGFWSINGSLHWGLCHLLSPQLPWPWWIHITWGNLWGMTWPDGTWLNVAIDMPCKPKEPPKQNLKTFIEIILVNFCLTTTVFCWQSEDENWFIFFFWGGLLFDCFWWFGGSPFLPTLIFQFNFCIWWIQTGVYTGYMCTFFACCIFLKYKSNEGDFFS